MLPMTSSNDAESFKNFNVVRPIIKSAEWRNICILIVCLKLNCFDFTDDSACVRVIT